MDFLFSITNTIRWVGVCQLSLLGVYFVLAGRNGRYVAFFCFTLICYLIIPQVILDKQMFIILPIVLFGAFGVAFALWILSLAIFDDSFRLQIGHGIAFILLEGISFGLFLGGTDNLPNFLPTLAGLFPQLINLGFVILTLLYVQKGTDSDLIEERRNFRSIFVMVSSVYIILVLVVEIGLKEVGVPRLLDSINVISVTALIYYFSFRLLELKTRFFLGTPAVIVTDAEKLLSQKIQALMDKERLFNRDDLNARVLATLLNEQEYKVRRAINGAMGYRNFYDFLNHFRVEEACMVLADESKQSIPIVRIAMDCGYSSLAPFNRAFKALKGMSPSEFRKREISSSNL